jgi:excisionase family DNA binding protein
MAIARPALLTVDEAAVIARCSIKTVRRAYASGALTAYRRRGSRAVLLNNEDVLEWAQGQVVQPNPRFMQPSPPEPAPRPGRKPIKRGDRLSRAAAFGSQHRFDLSAEALRERRNSNTESLS